MVILDFATVPVTGEAAVLSFAAKVFAIWVAVFCDPALL